MTTLTVNVEVVPTSGQSTERSVTIEATGASLKEVLDKAGVRADKMHVSINGEPATDMQRHVAAGSKVTLTERVRGS